MLNRIFTAAEQTYCTKRARAYEHYAARFAAKEAFIKALGLEAKHGVALTDIEVRKRPSGKPYIFLSASLLKKTKLKKNTQIELSLTHEREYAVASVIIIKD